LLDGAVFLVDERFREKSHVNGLSKWMRPQVKPFENFEQSQDNLKVFLSEISTFFKTKTISNEIYETLSQCSDQDDPLFIATQKESSSQNVSLTQVYSQQIISNPKRKLNSEINNELVIELICKSCDSSLNSISVEPKTFELKSKPFLEQLMMDLGCQTKEISVLKAESLQNLSISNKIQNSSVNFVENEKIIKFDKFSLKLPSLIVKSGGSCNTGWIESDELVYELLFCSNCNIETQLLGVKIIASSTNDLDLLNQIWIFKSRVEFKKENATKKVKI
jgi:hypothetical protein